MGATDSLNKVVFGFMEDYLSAGDEVIISKSRTCFSSASLVNSSKT